MMEALLTQATTLANSSIAECDAAAKQLGQAMQRVHGGVWRIQIDHEDELVVVARDRRKDPPIAPKPEANR